METKTIEKIKMETKTINKKMKMKKTIEKINLANFMLTFCVFMFEFLFLFLRYFNTLIN